MTRCVAHRCPEEALPGHQLCRRHQRRLEAGGGLPVAGDPVPGDPSGHGRYGILDTNEYGVLCHECGERFASVGIHSQRTHHLSAGEYRQRHGVEGSLRIPSGEAPRRRAKPCRWCGKVLTTRRKTCDECLARRRSLRQAPKLPRPRWRELSAEEAATLVEAEGDELAVLVQALQANHVSSRTIGGVLGLRPQQMSARYPRAEYRRG